MEHKKFVCLFAGQGSQYIGMGKDFYDNYDYVRTLYDEASSILGYDIAKICFEENENLNQTIYTQPAVVLTTIAIYEVARREYGINPTVVAGFSLGEYAALYAAGIFSFKDILYLINNRAHLMDREAIENPGSMAAIIGMDRDVLNDICNEVGNVVIANYNSSNQLVISGLKEAVNNACEIAKTKGAKRAIPLNVSGAFHSFLMHNAAIEMGMVINKVSHNQPNVDIVMNVTARPLIIDNLFELMMKQIESPVYWEDSIKYIIENYDIDTFIEFGPGNVLSGLMRKIDSSKQTYNISKIEELNILK